MKVRWEILQAKKETAVLLQGLDGLRKFGHVLSEMMMPNLSIFIAWGLLSISNQLFFGGHTTKFSAIEQIMLHDLLPILIGLTGGKILGGSRGGVVGAMATVGVIAGSNSPQVFGAMILGPLGGFFFAKADKLLKRFIKPGYEMLVRNLTAGIVSGGLCYLGLIAVAPLLNKLNIGVAALLTLLIRHDLLPVLNILIEPLKVLFLNNALNHGIFTPLGIENVETTGKSILFLLEANPGPGLGVLLAFFIFGNKKRRVTSGSAIFIQLIGGLHEIYFPFVLSDLRLLTAVVLGGSSGSFIFQLFGSSLTGPASPGSLVTIFASASASSFLGIGLGILVSTVVSFIISSIIIKSPVTRRSDKKTANEGEEVAENKVEKMATTRITDVIFVCDAGMGSSAMGASLFRHLLIGENLHTPVNFTSIYRLEDQAQRLVITQPGFAALAKKRAPQAVIETIENFLDEARYEELLQKYFAEKDRKTHESAQKIPVCAQPKRQFIFLYGSQVRGSQTIAVTLMQQQAKNLGVAAAVKKAALTEAIVPQATYVVSQEFLHAHPEVKQWPNLVVVAHLLLTKRYEALLKGDD